MNFQGIFLFTSSAFLKKVFLGALFILICISAFTYRHTLALSDSTASVIHSKQVHLELEQLMSYIKDAETGQRGYMITLNPVFLQPYNGSREKVESSYRLLRALTSDNLKQQNNLDSLYKTIDLRYSLFKKALILGVQRPINTTEFNKTLVNGKIVMDDIRNRVDKMIDLEFVYLKERQAKYENEISFTPIFTMLLFLFTTLIFVIAYMMINRDLKNVTKANEKLMIMNESINQTEEVGNTGSWQWNIESNSFIYSDNLFRLLGTNPNSFKSNADNFIDFVHPEDKHILMEGLEKVLNQNETSSHFFRVIRKDGELRYFTSNSKILEDKNGKKVVIGVTTDVTFQHLIQLGIEQRNHELESANAELLITTESINHAEEIGEFSTWQWDLDTNTLKYSDNQYRLLGCEPQSFEPTIEKYLEFVHPEDQHIINQGGQEVLNNVGIPTAFFRIIRKDGQIRYIKSIAKSLIDVNGKNTLIGINSDVTEQHLSSLSLEQQNLELEQSNKELASFNHVASHDLQEPLRKIQLFVSRIEENEKQTLTEIGKEYFDRIKVSALRMRVLIDDLLLFSRTNKAEKVFERTDINVIFEKAKHELGEAIIEKNGTIQTVRLPILNVIPFQIEQLFINLISNSLKYNRVGVNPVIKIECEKIRGKDYSSFKVNGEKKYFKFSFTDNGLGFEQKNADSIFTLFHRLHHKNEYSGTGIGLSICKKIVENHAGFITAEGRPDNGSTFTFFLPE
jgi:signal transduction histidine kinase/CHASE3 domain sensor protein